jgi:hypothetical protein
VKEKKKEETNKEANKGMIKEMNEGNLKLLPYSYSS